MAGVATLTGKIDDKVITEINRSISKSVPNSPQNSPPSEHKTPPPIQPKPKPKPKPKLLVKSFLTDEISPSLSEKPKPTPPPIKAKPLTPVLQRQSPQLPPKPAKTSLQIHRTSSAGLKLNNDHHIITNPKFGVPQPETPLPTKPKLSISDKPFSVSVIPKKISATVTERSLLETPEDREAKTISRDSGIEVSPFKRNSDTDSPDLNTPPKLPIRPNTDRTSSTPPPLLPKVLIVPRMKQSLAAKWTTVGSQNDEELLNNAISKCNSTEDTSKHCVEYKSKIYRTLPSRKSKLRRRIIDHEFKNNPVSPPLASPTSTNFSQNLHRKLSSPQTPTNTISEDTTLAFSQEILESYSEDEGTLKRRENKFSSQYTPTSIASFESPVMESKQKHVKKKRGNFLKKLFSTSKDVPSGEQRSHANSDSNLTSSISTPSLVQLGIPGKKSKDNNSLEIPLPNSGSNDKKVEQRRSFDDSYVFENNNQSESEDDDHTDTRNTCKIDFQRKDSFDDVISDHVPPPLPPKLSETDSNFSSILRERSSQELSKKTSSANLQEDFQYLYENLLIFEQPSSSESDQETSDLEAFDDADELANDSDNEMTEEQLKAVKLKTIARAASNTAFSKCYYVAREILTTEEHYVKKLHLLLYDLGDAIDEANKKQVKPILSEENRKRIFSNLPVLYNVNSTFRNELKSRVDKWTKANQNEQKIGDIMQKHSHFFKCYSEFISHFNETLKLLDELSKKSKEFNQFLRTFQSRPQCGSLPISAHLLAVVQRIPRYKLLLTEYIKHLPENSIDLEDSKKALELISEVADHVNNNLKQIDNFKKKMEILSKIDGDLSDLLQPSRQFIKGGELKKASRKGFQIRNFFLFTDVLLQTIPPSSSSGNYSLHARIPLAGIKVEDFENAKDLLASDPLRYGFKIISPVKSFIVATVTQEEKDDWINTINATIENNIKKIMSYSKRNSIFCQDGPVGSLAPVWIPDSSVSMCMMCFHKFTFTRRRHHCRGCGKVLCGPCSDYKAPLKYLNYKPERVCLDCHADIVGSESNQNPNEYKNTNGDNSDVNRRRNRLKKEKSLVPSHLQEVSNSDSRDGQVVKGMLEYNEHTMKFKHSKWVVLKELVIYIYKKREDTAAEFSIPILGYQLNKVSDTTFSLSHKNINSHYFRAEDHTNLLKWINALEFIFDPHNALNIVQPVRRRSATESLPVSSVTDIKNDLNHTNKAKLSHRKLQNKSLSNDLGGLSTHSIPISLTNYNSEIEPNSPEKAMNLKCSKENDVQSSPDATDKEATITIITSVITDTTPLDNGTHQNNEQITSNSEQFKSSVEYKSENSTSL